MRITGNYADDELLSSAQVGKALGLGKTAVAWHVNRGNLKCEPRTGRRIKYKWRNVKAFAAEYEKRPRLGAAFFAGVGDLYKGGMSIRQIAERKGVEFGTIRRYLIENDIPLRGRGGDHRACACHKK